MTLFICDIDGCLADIRHLLPLIKVDEKGHKDFTEYDARLMEAESIPLGIALIKSLNWNSLTAIFITGRKESTRKATLDWLSRRAYLITKSYSLEKWTSKLLMRPDRCYEPAWKVKERHVLALKEQGLWKDGEVIVLEDDQSCVEMYRRHGAYVLQAHNDASRCNGMENK